MNPGGQAPLSTKRISKPRRAFLSLRAADVQLYRVCDVLTEAIVYFVVLFGPWAFGTTQPWSIWTMNVAGYALGLLWLIKLGLRHFKGHHPARWDHPESASAEATTHRDHSGWLRARSLTAILGGLTCAILGYCLISALNARATYHADQLGFVYHDFIPWLPHSFDRGSTWSVFWTGLGLAGSFWAIRDWIPGKSSGEQLAHWQKSAASTPERSWPFPARLRRLLWLLAINGALLAAESIIQRLENSPKLLFLVLPRIHQTAESQFGPYAYRANAAQYFNLLWPVCLGFWWTLNRTAGRRRSAHHCLLGFAAIMAACPIISTSRGGALILLGMVILAAIFLLSTHFLVSTHRQESKRGRTQVLGGLTLFLLASLSLGLLLGWKALRPRMSQLEEGFQGREQIYEIARGIGAQYPVFGIGPGAYESVSELYRPPTDDFWPAQVHNDWLELRVTFGWVGAALIYTALAVVLLRWFTGGGIHGGRRFVFLTWLALAGCLAHARFDFPFQVHSILFLFLTLCAILFSLSREP